MTYLSGRPESWVPNPTSYILMHEPPARIYYLSFGSTRIPPAIPYWFQWHRARAYTEFKDPRIAPPLFISPILFVDGHTAVHDFTRALTKNVRFPYEPTKDWVWYKPADE